MQLSFLFTRVPMKRQTQIRRQHQRRERARSRKYPPALYLHLQIFRDTALHVRALTRRTNIEFTPGKIRVQIPGMYPRSCTYTLLYVHNIASCRVSRDACRIFECYVVVRFRWINSYDDIVHEKLSNKELWCISKLGNPTKTWI